MLFDFMYYNPTRIHFGKDSLNSLKEEIENFGETVLLLYGKNSIKKIGLYDKVIKILNDNGKKVIELSGVMANPTYEKVLEGGKLVRDNNVDLILGVGGGSVIDCAKAISVSAYCEGDAFKRYWLNFEPINNKIVPVGAVLTMVGTGSEMNGGSVITNEELKIKTGRVYSSEVYPKFSILNPEYTFSVPKYQMVSGIFDIMSHLMEQYFSGKDNNTTDYVIEGLLRSVIDNARVAIKNPMDYEARSNLMWSATLALNTISGLSKEQDWEVHMIEHQLGAYTDCAHGMGLAAISIPYYNYIYSYGLDKFVKFAKNIWGISEEGKTKDQVAREGISCLEAFIKECGMVTSLKELGATKEMLPLIANSTVLGGGYKKLNAEDILKILEKCY